MRRIGKKTHQHLFWKKFLPTWVIVGILYSLALAITFGVKDIYGFLTMIGICTFCAVLSATINWWRSVFLTYHWLHSSANMTGTFWGEAMIITVILDKDDWLWGIIPSSTLLAFIVNYLILRKNVARNTKQYLHSKPKVERNAKQFLPRRKK